MDHPDGTPGRGNGPEHPPGPGVRLHPLRHHAADYRHKELLLYAGDSIYFDSTLPHGMKAVGGPVTFLAIVIRRKTGIEGEKA